MNLPKDLDKYILLYLYDELSENEKAEFETHLEYNEESRQKVDEMRTFHQMLDKKAMYEPTEQLLASSRNELRERLRTERRPAVVKETWFDSIREFVRFRRGTFELVGALALIFIGIIVGRTWLSSPMPIEPATEPVAISPVEMAEDDASITNVDLIQYDPNSGAVTVHYKSIQDVSLQGNIEDPTIRRALTHAIRTEQHPGRRLEAVKATKAGIFSDPELEAALIHAMEKDEIDGVRLRAAQALAQLSMNQNIKRTFIRVLMKDSNPAVRMQALNALSEIDGADVAPVFQNASQDDDNEFIRLSASKALERTENPEVN